MIQELFGGGSAPSGLLGERKISNPFSSPSSQTCPTSTPILTTTSIATTASSASLANPPISSSAANNNNHNSSNSNNSSNSSNNNSENNPSQQNLRCPRCDSTNTKFCYYNNYNLTQPRHFCKTCRRYWTKGGTLRNVPIGGGCRKNKSTTASAASATSGFTKTSSNAMAKAKATLSTELLVNGNPGFLGNGLLDHLHHHPDLQQGVSSNPILWPSLQQNSSHILSLLRGSNQFHNHNPNPNPMSNVFTAVKTEGNNSATTYLGLDSYGNGAPSLLGSYPRSNQQQANGFSSGVQEYAQNNGNSSNIIELYQRLKSSSNYNNYCGNENQGTVIFGNMMGSPSSSPSSPMHSNILDSAPVGGGGGDNYGGYSFMSSPAISGWSDYPTVPINGSYP